MKSDQAGKGISEAEVTNISQHGIWLYVKQQEYFLPFDKFPWFKKAAIGEILEVEFIHDHHLRWEKLDIDLELDCLENPDDYPLVYQVS